MPSSTTASTPFAQHRQPHRFNRRPKAYPKGPADPSGGGGGGTPPGSPAVRGAPRLRRFITDPRRYDSGANARTRRLSTEPSPATVAKMPPDRASEPPPAAPRGLGVA